MIPQSRLKENVRGILGTAGDEAAHDAADAGHAIVVGNDHMAGAECICLLVQPGQRFAAPGAVDAQIALHLARVKDVQGAVAVIGKEIGDIDQG